jgi:hypothetical protein
VLSIRLLQVEHVDLFIFSFIFVFYYFFTISRRHRDFKPETTPYQVESDTVKIENGHLNAHLLNTKNSIKFTLDLYLLKDSRFRFRINELSPLKKRYEVEGVIVDTLEQEK